MRKSIDGITRKARAQGGADAIDTGYTVRHFIAAAVLLVFAWAFFSAFVIVGQSMTGEYCYYNTGVPTCN